MKFKFRCPRKKPYPDCVGSSNDPKDFYFHKSERWKGRVRFCKPCAKAAVANWQAINPERVKATCAKWRAENAERYKANQRRWYAKHPECAKANARRWKAKNPERVKANKAKWKAKNPERVAKLRDEHREDYRLAHKRRRACRPRWSNAKTLLRPVELERRAIIELTGLEIEDDHIMQLQPRLIFIEGFGKVRPWTGLDVPNNLQHLTSDDHKAKHNGTGYAKFPIKLNRHGEVVQGKIERSLNR